MKPFFSIIIPLFNKEKYVSETLKSVLNQTFKGFEIIIVNDGSTDNSLSIVNTFNDERIKIINQDNQGVSVARNNGITKAEADYIALIDADDYWYKNHLSELKKQIEKFPEAGLFCNNYEVFYSEKFCRPAAINLNFKKECLLVNDFFKASVFNSVALTSAVCVQKKVFNTIGKFNCDLKSGQDIDLWIRIALKHEVSFNPKITMAYKFYDHNSLSKKEFNRLRYNFISNFKEEENKNNSLKLYLDRNRYAVALRSKMNNDLDIYKKLRSEIDYKNLNFKQKIIINSPKSIIRLMKNFQKKMIQNKYYFTANR